jgi:hypothetical protein
MSQSASRSSEPSGAQYHLKVSSDDLSGWMAPGRKAPVQPGSPVEVG